jgi:hypothetical protein
VLQPLRYDSGVYTVGLHPDDPNLVAAGGASGSLRLYDTRVGGMGGEALQPVMLWRNFHPIMKVAQLGELVVSGDQARLLLCVRT